MKIFILLLGFSFSAWSFDHSHQKWDQILKVYLTSQQKQTLFDYQKLKENTKALESYLKDLSSVSKKEYGGFSQKEKLSFLINAYNAFTVKLIVDHYPVKSIKDIGSFFKSSWKIKFFKFLGKKFYLDGIEHEMIRKDFDEPRIHFAVNCASISCPSLLSKAFTANKLNKQLDQAAKNFLLNKKKNRVEKNKLSLSKIFKWYGDDFKKKYGSYLHYIAPIISSEPAFQKKIREGQLDVDFLSYNWQLNEVK